MTTTPEPQTPKCRGLVGRLCGHKFIARLGGDYVYESQRCFRCGYVPTVRRKSP